MWSPAQRCLIGFLVTLLPFSLTPAAEWDGEPWADYSPFMTPITLPTKQNLLGIKSTGDTLGRIPGRMGQIGDSISNPGAFFRNAVLFPVLANETGHDYAPIRSWLAYSGTQPGGHGRLLLRPR